MNAILLFQGSKLGNHVHPFLLNEVMEFSKKYKMVYLICEEFSLLNVELSHISNCKIIEIKSAKIRHNYSAIFYLLNKYGLADLKMAKENKILNLGYFKNIGKTLAYGTLLAKEGKKIIKKNPNEIWIVEAYWLSGPAYAAAVLKKNFKNIIAISRAHSSEIDVIRNPYSICQLKFFINTFLDKIYFISNWGKEQYEKQILPNYNVVSAPSKTIYLGTIKQFQRFNGGSNDDIFRILTCSRIVKLKRLDLLLKVLKENQFEGKIKWIHIGDGKDIEYYRNIKISALVEIEFLGDMINSEVHRYLALNPVDLFINLSEFEGLPVSIMEAMSYGIPILATDTGGTSEIVNSSNGCLIPVNSSTEKIAKEIKNIMSLSKDKREILQSGAYTMWKEKCDKVKNYNIFFDDIKKLSEESN